MTEYTWAVNCIETLVEAEDLEQTFQDRALRYMDGLYAYAVIMVGDYAKAEGLVHETYLHALDARHRLCANNNLKSWLFTILRNLRFKRENGPDEIEDETAQHPTLTYADRVSREKVQQTIRKLPEIDREIIVLREFEELSYQELSQVLNCPVGTVMSRLSRARERLRDLLQGLRTEEE
jgi:RNA polymerase sigma-70 factor, ECF subfamily